MSTDALHMALEEERAARMAAEARIVALNEEIAALNKQLPIRPVSKDQALVNSNIMLGQLITNMPEGILVENEFRKVTLVNDNFCRQFGLTVPVASLIGSDCTLTEETSKHMFKDPDGFVQRIRQLLEEKKTVLNDELELKDGGTYIRDYIPIFFQNKYRGHLWKYSDVTVSRTIEQKLETQRKFYEQILNNIPADISVLDQDHRFLFLNPTAVSNPEIRKWAIGKTDEEYCVHSNKPLAITENRKKPFAKVLSTRKQTEWEEQIIRPDGVAEHHLRRMYPVTNENGNLDMVIGYGVNITNLRKTEENLKLSEKRYREIFSFSQAWICTHNMEGALMTVNPAACKILGYTEKELIGLPIQRILSEKTRLQFFDGYLTEINTDGKSEGIMNVINKSGKNIFLLYQNYLVSEAGADPYVICFAQNITDRLHAEDALKRSEEKYRGIIDNMNLGMLEVDTNQHIIYANQQFCNMCGYTRDELTSQNASEMFVHDDSNDTQGFRALQGEYSIANSQELSIKTKTGASKWWLASNAPLLNEDGSLKGSISIHLDITKQKNMERQLREAKLDAERSSDSKEIFLTNMSHEIRTPINAIMGLGKLLGKSALDEQQKYYLSSIRAASENLLVIINDILDFSKIEAGKIALESMPFDLKKITGQAINMLTHKAEEKGLVLNYEIDDNIASKLIGDPFRINQVLINMLSNAIKFTEKGSINLKAYLAEETDNFQKILITIKDTGVGISEEFLKNIFKKFTQEDETVARKFGGTGLGMSITKQLMELMGGVIDVTSKKDSGTLISLEFKFKIGTEKVFEKKRAINKVDTSNIRNKRILLVEDNDLNRLLAFTILKQYGAIVAEAENGAIAVELMRLHKFDIVLMDVQMPVMDGVTATQIIRQEISKNIPIIALTANAIKGKKEQYIQSGMNDYISKPYDEEKMISLISNWINNSADLKFGSSETDHSENEEAVLVVAAVDEEPLYDIKKLTKIGSGNNDFVVQMLKLFINDVPKTAQRIKDAHGAGDFETVKYLAHRIRPSLNNMAINLVKDDIMQIEKLAEHDQANPMLGTRIDNIIQVIDRVVYLLRQEHSI
jgi:PAS domain S-box-containing protein